MPGNLKYFLSSPVSRHPFLLGRKIAARLGFKSAAKPRAAPALPRILSSFVPVWSSWVEKLHIANPPPSPEKVFGQNRDRQLLLHCCRHGMPDVNGLEGDIKLVWEYSRANFLPLHAAFSEKTEDEKAAELAGWISTWIENNPPDQSVTWTCAMEVAIRAVNWLAADALLGGNISARIGWQHWADQLWNHGQSIWNRLEAQSICSNHYLANLLGLAWIGSVFQDTPRGRKWLDFSILEWPRALRTQTRPDGGAYEASLPYHELYVELALLSLVAMPESKTVELRAMIARMANVIAALKRSDGGMWPVGDDDSGRVIAMDEVTREKRAEVLLALAKTLDIHPTPKSRLFPDSGWWRSDSGDFDVLATFGGAGFHGWGGHAHNDLLAICVDHEGQPVLVDRGTWLYTSNLEGRRSFRSTSSHNTIMIDQCEQRIFPPLKKETAFLLPGSDNAANVKHASDNMVIIESVLAAQGEEVFAQRSVSISPGNVIIQDELRGRDTHDVQWFFHLAKGLNATTTECGWKITDDQNRHYMLTANIPVTCLIKSSTISPAYGQLIPSHVLIAQMNRTLPVRITWTLQITANPADA
ncbi:MAG TPA: heparinase II/III-family protein [Kiritimatiellia bacterium]|nr:heparinase II/III-family protein [Kiritimatiellia bacterium]